MKVWLLGDSIRLFYEKSAIEKLGDGYEVFSPKENCRFSSYVLNSIRLWLKTMPVPDIVHFNAGLWDTAIIYREDGPFTALSDYVRDMSRIVRELRRLGAKVIFATTTPVADVKATLPGPTPPAHKNDDIMRYNEAVVEMLRGTGVEVNNLFSAMYPERDKYLSEDLIHPNALGVEMLAEHVAEAIRAVGEYHNEKARDTVLEEKQEEKTIQ